MLLTARKSRLRLRGDCRALPLANTESRLSGEPSYSGMNTLRTVTSLGIDGPSGRSKTLYAAPRNGGGLFLIRLRLAKEPQPSGARGCGWTPRLLKRRG